MKWALITGGTKGLGLSCAEKLIKKDIHVILGYRKDQESAKKAQLKLGNMATILQADLTDEGERIRFYSEVKEMVPQLDYYIHNAAATSFKSLRDVSEKHFHLTFGLTIYSLITGVNILREKFIHGASCVTISGMDTLQCVPHHGVLAAAKSSLEMLTKYMAHEWAPQIRFNCVNPGFIPTDSTKKYLGKHFEPYVSQLQKQLPGKKAPKVEDIANGIMFLLSKESQWILGQTITVDGGQTFSIPGEFRG